jgi:hypothetical protein
MSALQSNNPYGPKISKGNFAEYIRQIIRVSPEDVIADARAAGLMVNSVNDFRSSSPGAHHMVDQLTNHYVNQAAKWCAFSGATSGVGGVVTAITLGVADFIHVAGRLYRLCLRLAILNGFDPRDPIHREAIEEIYLASLDFDATEKFILRGFLGRPAAKAGRLRASVNYVRLIIAVGRKLWARRLAFRVTSRFFPVVGATVGAGSNYYFAKRVGRKMSENLQRIGPITHDSRD